MENYKLKFMPHSFMAFAEEFCEFCSVGNLILISVSHIGMHCWGSIEIDDKMKFYNFL